VGERYNWIYSHSIADTSLLTRRSICSRVMSDLHAVYTSLAGAALTNTFKASPSYLVAAIALALLVVPFKGLEFSNKCIVWVLDLASLKYTDRAICALSIGPSLACISAWTSEENRCRDNSSFTPSIIASMSFWSWLKGINWPPEMCANAMK